MTAADYLMLISMVCIWALMAINVFLSVGGFLYYHQCSKTDGHMPVSYTHLTLPTKLEV